MARTLKWGLTFGLTIAIAAAMVGCGGDGSTSGVMLGKASSTGANAGEETRQEPPGPPAKNSKPLVRQFTGIDSYIAGRSLASEEEQEAASEALESFTEAQSDEDTDAVCERLSATMLEHLEQLIDTAPEAPEDCGDALALALEHYSDLWEVNSLPEPISFLLVKGNSGYALFHGTKGWDYLMQMSWEGGEWKVNSFNSMPIGCRIPTDPECHNSDPS